MSNSYSDPRKIRSRLRSDVRALQKEKAEYGDYDDSRGRRYLIGPLYMLLGESDDALEAFRWFDREFSDDVGEPGHSLCWSLALYRDGSESEASTKLRQLMLLNLYVLPHLLELPVEELDISHDSSDEDPAYVRHIPPEYFGLWTETERDWASHRYRSNTFRSIRARYIEISRLLEVERPGPVRTRLVREMSDLGR